MCQQGRSDARVEAQGIRRRTGAPSVQFWPVILSNLTPVLTQLDLLVPGATFARRPRRSTKEWRVLRDNVLALPGAQLVEPVQHDDHVASVRPAPNHDETISVGVNVVRCPNPIRGVRTVVEEHGARIDHKGRRRANCCGDHALRTAIEELPTALCPTWLTPTTT